MLEYVKSNWFYKERQSYVIMRESRQALNKLFITSILGKSYGIVLLRNRNQRIFNGKEDWKWGEIAEILIGSYFSCLSDPITFTFDIF